MPIKNPKQNNELLLVLNGLVKNWENEVIEFKEASKDFKQDEIGQYFSAISNEANLKGLQYGWLVFGVNNKSQTIVGTDYRAGKDLDALKHDIAQNSTGNITFIDVFEVFSGDIRIVMFKIPAAVTAVPTAWKNHWYGREGESLGALSVEELDRIRSQVRRDWSSQVIEGSGISDLDADAIKLARENYKQKLNRPHISDETDKMTDEQFLTKIKLLVGGKATNAAMVLLGNPDRDNLMNVPVRIMWRLYGSNNMVKDYQEFGIPFISVVDKVYAKIRNLIYRYMPNQLTLFPTETQQYDANLLRELLNNAIAHQDLTLGGRIYLDEYEDTIVISNPGTFIPGDVRKVLKPGYTAPYYRNQLLADAMVKFDMIDTVQMGILKVYNIQRSRYFPLPDYDFTENNKVAVKIYGKVLDENYTRVLFERVDLELEDVFLIDIVQKKRSVDKEQYKRLQTLGVIEGKFPKIFISAKIAEILDEKAQYIRNKGMDDKYYMDLIVNYLKKFGQGTKADFIKLIAGKLSDVLTIAQKERKVKYLILKLQQAEVIERTNSKERVSGWRLKK
jgi:ATP-dependent DNA helicase RecG